MSHRVYVTKKAKLRNGALEADCLVTATEVTLPNSGLHPEYAHMSIQNAPVDLPEGVYEVTFPGYSGQVRKRNGFWIAP